MMRTIFAIAFAGVIFAAVSGTAQAAPVAPLPAAVAADLSYLTDVQWRRCWGRLHCRRCWRDGWGRVRCW